MKQHLTSPQLAGAGLVVAAIVGMQLRRRPKLRLVERPVVELSPVLDAEEPLAA